MLKGDGGDDMDDGISNEAAQPVRRAIRERDNGRQQMKKGCTWLKEAIFYADNGMVASTNLGWLHTAFDILKVLFERMGLKTNV